MALLLSVASPFLYGISSVTQGSLIVPSGKKLVLDTMTEALVLDELRLGPGAILDISNNEHLKIVVASIVLGKGSEIRGRRHASNIDKPLPGKAGDYLNKSCEALPGEDGQSGLDGVSAVSLTITATRFQADEATINLSASEGMDGTNGGAGADALKGCEVASGANGGGGGDGGDGGDGGHFILKITNTDAAKNLKVIVSSGDGGRGGAGGGGGEGLKGYYKTKRSLTGNRSWVPGGKAGLAGAPGRDGRKGRQGIYKVYSLNTKDQAFVFQPADSIEHPLKVVPEQDDTHTRIEDLERQVQLLQQRIEALEKK